MVARPLVMDAVTNPEVDAAIQPGIGFVDATTDADVARPFVMDAVTRLCVADA